MQSIRNSAINIYVWIGRVFIWYITANYIWNVLRISDKDTDAIQAIRFRQSRNTFVTTEAEAEVSVTKINEFQYDSRCKASLFFYCSFDI